MTTKQRIADVHYYEWSVVRWFTSDTRAQLDPTGRGIFRDLIDLCYAQGSIPKDPELLCRKTDATREQFNRVWPIIEHHFHQHKRHKNLLVNDVAEVYRKQFFSYLKEQKRHGKSGSDKRWTGKGNGDSDMDRHPIREGNSQEEKRREEKRREETTKTTPPRPIMESDWPESAEFVCAEFPTTDSALMRQIIETAAREALDSGLTLTDGTLLDALKDARKASRDQYSAVLYLKTVPALLRNWAAEVKRRKRG